MTLSLLKTPQELMLEQAGIPHMQAGGKAVKQHTPAQQALLAAHGFGAGVGLGREIKDPIKVYRSDPQGRHGGKEGLETLPTTLDKATMQAYVRAMREGEPYGVPQLPPEYLANLALTEGRSDFGFNNLNENNPRATQIASELNMAGHEDTAAGFGAALYDKMNAANRLKKPFTTLWNGTGTSKVGLTGNDYTGRFTNTFPATMHPQNQELLDTIREAYNNPAPKQQPVQNTNMPSVDQMGNPMPQFSTGGSTTPFYDMSKLLIQKYLGN